MPSNPARSGSCEKRRKAALERIAAVHAESHRRLLALRELREGVAKSLSKWRDYAEEMRKGMRFLVHEETKEMATLQLEMAERFIADLERLAR